MLLAAKASLLAVLLVLSRWPWRPWCSSTPGSRLRESPARRPPAAARTRPAAARRVRRVAHARHRPQPPGRVRGAGRVARLSVCPPAQASLAAPFLALTPPVISVLPGVVLDAGRLRGCRRRAHRRPLPLAAPAEGGHRRRGGRGRARGPRVGVARVRDDRAVQPASECRAVAEGVDRGRRGPRRGRPGERQGGDTIARVRHRTGGRGPQGHRPRRRISSSTTKGGGRTELTYPGLGETVRQENVEFRGFETYPGVAQIEENRRSVERLVGARLLGDSAFARSVGWNGLALARLSRPQHDRYQSETGRLDAVLTLVARRAAIAAAVPLRKGASARIGDIVFSIADILDLARPRPSGRTYRTFVVDLQLSTPRTLSADSFGRIGFLLPEPPPRARRRHSESGFRYSCRRGTGAMAAFCVRPSRLGVAHALGDEQGNDSRGNRSGTTRTGSPMPNSCSCRSKLSATSPDRVVRDFTLPGLYIRGEGLAGLQVG